jgi:hypothetical protein
MAAGSIPEDYIRGELFQTDYKEVTTALSVYGE